MESKMNSVKDLKNINISQLTFTNTLYSLLQYKVGTSASRTALMSCETQFETFYIFYIILAEKHTLLRKAFQELSVRT